MGLLKDIGSILKINRGWKNLSHSFWQTIGKEEKMQKDMYQFM